jgi:hypothetical protein
MEVYNGSGVARPIHLIRHMWYIIPEQFSVNVQQPLIHHHINKKYLFTRKINIKMSNQKPAGALQQSCLVKILRI